MDSDEEAVDGEEQYETDGTVWRVTADDPNLVREIAAITSDEQVARVGDFAITLGLGLWYAYDDDDVQGVPYVGWCVKVPGPIQAADDTSSVPQSLTVLVEHLRTRYAGFENWRVRLDAAATDQLLLSGLLRDTYWELIQAVEVVLLPLQTPEAARIDAMTRAWAISGPPLEVVGSYSLPLTRDTTGNWLLVKAGIAAHEEIEAESSLAIDAKERGVSSDQPVLLVPKPESPLYFVTISRNVDFGFERTLKERSESLLDGVGAQYRFVSFSPEELASELLRTVSAWWPGDLPGPTP